MDPIVFAIETARKAGDLLLKAREEGFVTLFKGGNPKDIVTSADKDISAFIVDAIQQHFPEHSVYSEEGGGSVGSHEYEWVIDPIDGSANFSRGIPHFAICIGLLHQCVPILGVVFNPVTKELFSFEKGKGAFLNGAPIRVSSVTDPKDAFVLLHAGRKEAIREWGGASYSRLLGTVKKTSNLGSSSLDACFVAAGRVEANVYGTLTTLDIASALGILVEAGGVVSDAEGKPMALAKEPQRMYMANNVEMLNTIRTLLQTP